MSLHHTLPPPTFAAFAGFLPSSGISRGQAPAHSLPLSQTRLRTLRSAGNRAVVTLARTARRSEEDRSLPIVRQRYSSARAGADRPPVPYSRAVLPAALTRLLPPAPRAVDAILRH